MTDPAPPPPLPRCDHARITGPVCVIRSVSWFI
uniref:Uncharacterized protein n=1 Tax=Arundo donax TaxID=35708 RepID=A0A0A9FU66_ARUDO